MCNHTELFPLLTCVLEHEVSFSSSFHLSSFDFSLCVGIDRNLSHCLIPSFSLSPDPGLDRWLIDKLLGSGVSPVKLHPMSTAAWTPWSNSVWSLILKDYSGSHTPHFIQDQKTYGIYLSGTTVRLLRVHSPCTSLQAFSSATTKPAPDSPPASKPAFLAHKTVCIPKNTFLIFKQFLLTVTCLIRRHEHFQRMIQPTSPPALPNQMTIPPEVPILLHWLKREPKTTTLDLNIWISECPKSGTKISPFPPKNGFTKAETTFKTFLPGKGTKMRLALPVLSSKIHPRRTKEPSFRMRLMTQNSWLGLIWFTLKSCILLISLTPADDQLGRARAGRRWPLPAVPVVQEGWSWGTCGQFWFVFLFVIF